jgi:NifU-like protein involved in Fe-S cluster formation
VAAALYTREILRLAASIPHQQRLAAPDATAEKRSPICGSQVVVDVVLDAEGRVAAIGQDVKACALGQASAALLGAHAIGATAAELAAARDTLGAYLRGQCEHSDLWPGLSLFAEARPFAARHPSILLPFEAAAEAAALAATAAAAKAA